MEPISINFDFLPETSGAEGIFFISSASRDESRITLASEKLLFTGLLGSEVYSSFRGFESGISVLTQFPLTIVPFTTVEIVPKRRQSVSGLRDHSSRSARRSSCQNQK